MSASRSTISFTEENWNKLAKGKNKSKMVNIALKFFFDSKDHLKESLEEFVLNELKHYEDTGESYSFEDTFK